MDQLHRWNVTPKEAVQIQRELKDKVKIQPLKKTVETVGGADISFNKFSSTIYVGIVVLSLPDLKEVSRSTLVTQAQFPYVPGLLSFRETPPLLEAWGNLAVKPDVLTMDGHGLAHPRRFGVACHFGLLTNTPALGCGKSRLIGQHEEPAPERGATADLVHKGEKIGVVLRTKNKVNPVFVSPGHLLSFEDSVDIVLKSDGKYRIPETTRQAHLLVNELRKQDMD
ncbi:MAG: deoxyribonuclease V [Bacteroidota bacterium]